MTDFESRLRAFRPRRPATIPDVRLQLLRGPIWIGVAATIAAAMLIVTWLKAPSADPRRGDRMSLTALALDNPDAFDAALEEISRAALPDVTRPGGALERLANLSGS
jgi:hypothetical protein